MRIIKFIQNFFFQNNNNEKNDIPELVRFSRKHWILLACIICLFTLLVSFRMHGYSISMWKNNIPGTEKSEIIWGKERLIRSDDWAVEIPLMLAQLSHDPKYPMINSNVVNGMNMLTHSKVFIDHPLTIFRPSTWGFLAGPDYGLSWMWWFVTLGMFYVYFLVFMIISRNRFYISLMGSLYLLFSPFFQFWSMHKAEIPMFMGLIFISFSFLCFGKKRITIISNSFLLGWSVSCYFINFLYPPFQVSCGYLLIFLIIAFIADRSKEFQFRENVTFRIAGILIAFALLISAISVYYLNIKDIADLMAQTTYPGKRFCIGGDYELYKLFSNNYLITFILGFFNKGWGPLTNICEGSSFLFFFPPIMIVLIYQAICRKKISDKFSTILIGYFVIMFVFLFWGFPNIFAKSTFFYLMPSNRSIIGMGIANVILVISFISGNHEIKKWERFIVSMIWAIILFYSGLKLKENFNEISVLYMTAVCIITMILSFYLLAFKQRQKMIILALLVAISIFSSAWFNPLVRGGSEFLYENPLSKIIKQIDEKENKNTVWISFAPWQFGNLFRILGINSLSGTHTYPQLELWERFDRDHKYFSEYNRYAHVSFKPSRSQQAVFHSPVNDLLNVWIHPSSKVLHDVGVTHMLVLRKDTRLFDSSPNLKEILRSGILHIYKVVK